MMYPKMNQIKNQFYAYNSTGEVKINQSKGVKTIKYNNSYTMNKPATCQPLLPSLGPTLHVKQQKLLQRTTHTIQALYT